VLCGKRSRRHEKHFLLGDEGFLASRYFAQYFAHIYLLLKKME
jgi:hypothetical protein